ncbi:MAG TPA: hypothetical protein VN441_04140 [Syntrophomonas sp.]|nr:hypothetical protein [Syntrophomonas sp.]
MNAIKDIYGKEKTKKAVKPDLTMIKNDKAPTKAEPQKYTNEELNEQMYYFYNNGGPAMDI